MSALGHKLLSEFDDEDWLELERRLADVRKWAAERDITPADDGWLDTRAAAAYAGCSVDALHRAMARHEVVFAQSGPGAKAYFKRSDIDTWRRGDGR